ncbi:hypothetical protein BV22DRAFT_1084069 [Leucogyrophana mollusca]|uniref:Uncharacterized protein n=1 Tax=Leucogyrophana mollusca TaxID=85980 RepID=A0ACB8BPT4_9AGAM|nr:hypothetical protein BV22DRAFT_1084069 [Leucogyrophana mollusca]
MDFPSGPGASGGPISPDAWKRAVYRSAPRQFYVELIVPEKQGGNYSYGIRVCPIKDDHASISSSSNSVSSKGSHIEYDVWRRWEDCLCFQENIEVEYSRMAREKRARLAAGKGVKKDGMYIQSDQAASFESLPPGPDPHSIGRDIHDYIPKLSKKGTLFRASQATIDQRFHELRAMIDALFSEGVPTLIKELKATRTFTDFFGYWRRDHDLALKLQKAAAPEKPRNSISNSVFSSYFSASTPGLVEPHPPSVRSPHKQPPRRSSAASDSSSSDLSLPTPKFQKHPIHPVHSDERSSRSRSQSAASIPMPPTPGSAPHTVNGSFPLRSPVIVSQDPPINFGYNPHHTSDTIGNERPTSSVLEALPEDRELSSPISISKGTISVEDAMRSQARRRAGSSASEANRNCRIFSTPPQSPSASEFSDTSAVESPSGSPKYARYSWQTTSSATSAHAATYFAELGVDLALPTPHPEYGHRPRASMCSMASFMTDSSADAILPRSFGSPQSSSLRRSMSGRSGPPRPMSLPEEEEWEDPEPWAEYDEGEQEPDEDLLDAYFHDAIRPFSPIPDSRAETPTGDTPFTPRASGPERSSRKESIGYGYSGYSAKRSSTTTSVSSGSTGSGDSSSISIKAMHENNIIMLRVPRFLPYEDVRQRIYSKFVGQEGSPLSESFAMSLLIPVATEQPGGVRPRTGSFSSAGGSDRDKARLQFISNHDDWEHAIAQHGSKVLLRLIGSRAS